MLCKFAQTSRREQENEGQIQEKRGVNIKIVRFHQRPERSRDSAVFRKNATLLCFTGCFDSCLLQLIQKSISSHRTKSKSKHIF